MQCNADAASELVCLDESMGCWPINTPSPRLLMAYPAFPNQRAFRLHTAIVVIQIAIDMIITMSWRTVCIQPTALTTNRYLLPSQSGALAAIYEVRYSQESGTRGRLCNERDEALPSHSLLFLASPTTFTTYGLNNHQLIRKLPMRCAVYGVAASRGRYSPETNEETHANDDIVSHLLPVFFHLSPGTLGGG
jgi:hypothetical protein